MFPAMPLSINPSSGASANADAMGNRLGGDWTVNIGGSGTALQSGSAGGGLGAIPPWMILAGLGVAAWLLMKR